MTDDQTRSYDSPETPATPAPAEPGATPAAETAPGAAETAPAATAPGAAETAPSATASAAPAAPAAPATNAAVAAKSGYGLRWAIGLGVAALVVVLTAGAVVLLGSPSTPEALKYIPGDAAIVLEVRMDLPGDQMQKLGNLLAHFPGFQDQSTLMEKIDESLSRLVAAAGEGQLDYRTDLKPWLNGPAFIGVMAPPSGSDDGKVVVSATTNGAVDCATVLKGMTPTHETVRGLDLVLFRDAGVACVVDGRQALLGIEETVRAALDAKANGTGMDKSTAYAGARKQLQGEQLASAYINAKSVAELMPSPDPSMAIPGLQAFAGGVPDWLIMGLRAEDDALVVDTVVGPLPVASGGPSLLPATAGHVSVITPLVPASTLLYFEDQGTGVSLQNLFAQLRAIPDLQAPLQMLDGVGGPAGLVGWIDDVAVAVSATNPTPEDPHAKASIYLVATDDATAAEKLATVKTAVGLAGLSGGGITVASETLSGVEVTTVTVTDLGAIVPPGSVPGVDPGALDTPVSFSIAARGRIIYLTVGDGAMAEVLAVQAGSSLADDAAFKVAVQRGLPNSKTTVYAAVGASVDLVKGFLPPEVASQWATEFAPYVDPLEALGVSVSMDASATRSRLVLTVSHP
jgi:Protein of unknown function (DUF3352)